MALNGLFCADVTLRNYSLAHLSAESFLPRDGRKAQRRPARQCLAVFAMSRPLQTDRS